MEASLGGEIDPCKIDVRVDDREVVQSRITGVRDDTAELWPHLQVFG